MAKLDPPELIKRAADYISEARNIIAFTGAGISTPSGIPDFRGGEKSLWNHLDPKQVASRTAYYQSPELFFAWFRPLFISSWQALPNLAHHGLVTLEKLGHLNSIITQNIDGLHQKAGSANVLELHGTALLFSCPNCHIKYNGEEVFSQFVKDISLPLCSQCKTILKPDVVLFDEFLPKIVWEKAQTEAALADLMLIIGSSLEVYPANTIPQVALQHGCKLIINNLSRTSMDSLCTLQVKMDAAEFFPLLLDSLK